MDRKETIECQCQPFLQTLDDKVKLKEIRIPMIVQVGLSPSKTISFICFNGNPLKIVKNTLSFYLKSSNRCEDD